MRVRLPHQQLGGGFQSTPCVRHYWLTDDLCICLAVLPACLQAGLVKAAAASGSVSAKARRKRKQQQQQVGPPGAAAAAAAVAWASRRLQQREYQAAWLAFLRTDLPSDIYKKVGGICMGRGEVFWLAHQRREPASHQELLSPPTRQQEIFSGLIFPQQSSPF